MKTKILFVCTGNICRSPTAEGIVRQLIERRGLGDLFEVDSAGTHDYHVGEAPDPRSIQAAAQRGYDLSGLRARRLLEEDFLRFDLLLAMDAEHLAVMRRMRPTNSRAKTELFMHYSCCFGKRDVPDPYYGGGKGFDLVLDYCEDAAEGLLRELI